jgi:hypothetical protein
MTTIEEKKKYLSTYNLEDYLDEDPLIERQNYFILSYLLPGADNNIDYPIFKVRGSYRTKEECSERIKMLAKKDTYFHMYTCEVGKFGKLIPDEQIDVLNTDIDIQYREAKLNEMVKTHKEAQDKSELVFIERKEKIQKSGLENDEETAEDIQKRIEYLHKESENMTQQLLEFKDVIKLSNEKLQKNFPEFKLKELSISNKEIFEDSNILPHERKN